MVNDILCDEAGFATEDAMPWVSSHIFRHLRDEQLLKAEPLKNLYSTNVHSELERLDLLESGRRVMSEPPPTDFVGCRARALVRSGLAVEDLSCKRLGHRAEFPRCFFLSASCFEPSRVAKVRQ